MTRRGLVTAGIMAILVGGAAAGIWANLHHEEVQARQALQVEAGQQLFQSLCETCHGPAGDGSGGAPDLTNGEVVSKYPTTQALAHFIQTRMPASDPHSLTARQAQDLALWIDSLSSRPNQNVAKLKLLP
ncbi:c-type cytochrome [Sulfobacillus harzensis]|uniref:Cytochrome c n=1 Tax=Sulfobacillus harzensis TaxID=2729629 RepID=A0A7Y0L293_9FIRM|nr:c-type cytochrome [Sulfobacillus harzensis]NMP21045.1 cytochrome c [Sulfobacillus harzensis]